VDSLDVIKVCLRRWYIFLPLVLLAAGAGVGLSKQVKPTYTATGSYAFLYPRPEAITPAADPRNQNPLVTQGYTALLGEAVQAQLSSASMQETLGRTNRGWAPDEPATNNHYTVTLPPQSASYIVQTWADTEEAAAGVVQAVLKAAPQSAKEAQERAGAPEASRYTAFITAATQTEQLPPQSPLKLVLTMVAIGALAGAALSLLVDRMFPKKRAKTPTSPRPRPVRTRTRTRPRAAGASGADGASGATGAPPAPSGSRARPSADGSPAPADPVSARPAEHSTDNPAEHSTAPAVDPVTSSSARRASVTS
jgi:hypothetical protein